MTTVDSRADPIAVVNHLIQTARPVIHIPAKVTSIGGYSAHADQKGLVEFVTGMQQWPTEIRVVHGEKGVKGVLASTLLEYYGERPVNIWTNSEQAETA